MPIFTACKSPSSDNFCMYTTNIILLISIYQAQSAGVAEYTDSIIAESKTLSNECPRYDTKQSDGEFQVMLELWGMRSTPLLSSLPGPLFLGVVETGRALYMG